MCLSFTLLVSQFLPCVLFHSQNLLLFHSPPTSGLNTTGVLQVVSISFLFCSHAFPQENQLGKHPLRKNPPRHTWHLWSENVLSFSAIVHLNITVRITVWYADRPISPDLSCHCLPILLVSQNGAHTERKLKKAAPTSRLHTVWISSHLVLLERVFFRAVFDFCCQGTQPFN